MKLFEIHFQGDEPAVKRNEQRLAALRELSDSVVPLKLRRMQLSKPTTVISLCDWIDEEVRCQQLSFTGSHLMLEIVNLGITLSFSICFRVPYDVVRS